MASREQPSACVSRSLHSCDPQLESLAWCSWTEIRVAAVTIPSGTALGPNPSMGSLTRKRTNDQSP